MKRKQKLTIFGGLTAFIVVCASCFILFRQIECRRNESPNKDFYAVVTCSAWQSWVPMMPGSSGDKSGYVTVFTRNGISCGTAPIELAWMVDEMRWSDTTAELKLVADWNLVKRTVELP